MESKEESWLLEGESDPRDVRGARRAYVQKDLWFPSGPYRNEKCLRRFALAVGRIADVVFFEKNKKRKGTGRSFTQQNAKFSRINCYYYWLYPITIRGYRLLISCVLCW